MQSNFPSVTAFVESREDSLRAIERGEVRSRGEYLQHCIGTDEVTHALQSIHGRLSIAMNLQEVKDSSFVDLLSHFNEEGIPVDMWPNLPDTDGYWIHSGNIPAARIAIFNILNVLERTRIRIERIGLDLECPAPIIIPQFNFSEWRKISPWTFSSDKASDELHSLVEEVLSQSRYGIDVYEVPILSDNPLMRRLLGIPKAPQLDSPSYKRVGLVYTSVKPRLIPPRWFMGKYSKGKGRIPAMGIVSSSSEENPGRVGGLLNDQEICRDVHEALLLSPQEFYVFALNGLDVVQRVRKAIQLALNQK